MNIYVRARLLATACALLGAMFIDSWSWLALGWLVVILLLTTNSSFLLKHAVFVVWVWIPITVLLFVTWAWLIASPPGEPIGSDPPGGMRFAALTSIRLAFVAVLFQAMILPIAPRDLPLMLWRIGCRGDNLLIILNVLNLRQQLVLRAQALLAARLARGVAGRPTRLNRAKQLGPLLTNLFAQTLREAIARADSWAERDLSGHISRMASVPERGSRLASTALVILSLTWSVGGAVIA